jgi:nucleotide-binding universal stress UspA family protein
MDLSARLGRREPISRREGAVGGLREIRPDHDDIGFLAHLCCLDFPLSNFRSSHSCAKTDVARAWARKVCARTQMVRFRESARSAMAGRRCVVRALCPMAKTNNSRHGSCTALLTHTMQIFKHILVPTDFGKASAAALELAVTMARAFDAKLTLLHVWELPVYPYMDFMLNSAVISEVEDAATKGLAQAYETLRKNFPAAQSKLKTGLPWQSVLEAVSELGADLVIMGTHGRHGLSRLTLGSVAERVVRMSSVPVLTVHGPAET